MARVEIEAVNLIPGIVTPSESWREIEELEKDEGAVITCINTYPGREGMSAVRKSFRPYKIKHNPNISGDRKQAILRDLSERMQYADLIVERREVKVKE